MAGLREIKVPDIGDFTDVPVIEVLVSVGDEVAEEDPLITLESDKATMDVPSPAAGTIEELTVAVGDEVTEGDVIGKLSGAGGEEEGEDEEDGDSEGSEGDGGDESHVEHGKAAERTAREEDGGSAEVGRVVVIGSGPGGYTAAFRAADLGLDVVMVERYETIGGVCLNVGCIPSKALLHAAEIVNEAAHASDFGIDFGEPEIDILKLDEWKSGVVDKLTGGLDGLAKRRKIKVVTGEAKFTGPNEIEVDGTTIDFSHCIIAAGSRPIELPDFPRDDERVIDSTGALALGDELPDRMLVVGGGIIGLEMANVYATLGSKVSVVELTDQLIPGCDPDLVKPLHKHLEPQLEAIHLETKVESCKATEKGLEVSFSGADAPEAQVYDKVLVAVGRRANGDILELGESGVEVADEGTIAVDERQRTNVSHIHAIGDVVGGPMLAHKATYEGVIAAEVIAGHDVVYDARVIPSVAYTDPEVAWVGVTETEAAQDDTDYEVAKFPWQASGRALSLGRTEGLTKLLVDPESRRIVGAGIVGPNAGELIGELCLAIEMGAVADDIGLTIHPHPTLSETITFAAEVAEGVATDIYAPKREKEN